MASADKPLAATTTPGRPPARSANGPSSRSANGTSSRSANTGASSAFKRAAIALGVVAYMGAAYMGTIYGTSAMYMALHKEMPHGLSMDRFWEQWDSTVDAPQERRKLKLGLILFGVTLFVALPSAVAAGAGRKRELHGSARWANNGEIRKAGLLSEDPGIVIGKVGNRFLTLTGQQSVMLSAPTRSGKGVGVVIPNCLSWPDSIVVADIKGENYKLTAGFREKYGQAVFKWAPFATDGRTHCWNPLSTVRAAERFCVGDILAIGQVLYPTQSSGSDTDKFFNSQARNLFLGLGLFLVETPELPRTIGEMLRQSSGKGKSLKDHLQHAIAERAKTDRPLSETCIDALNRFMGTSDNTLSSIKATFDAPLTIFADPFVDAATSKDDFALQDLRRRPTSVYVCIPPDKLADAAVVLNLFFSQAVNLNTTVLPEDDPTLRFQCLLVMDEFTAMGRLGALAKGISYIAGYNLRVLTVVQAVSQLDSTYGKDEARTFSTNHALQILYAPREQRDANEYSEQLGTFTEKSESTGRSLNHSARGGSSTSRNVSPQRRALLLPQEFKELGTGKEVVMLENCKPILADKIRYYEDPVFTPRLLPPPEAPLLDLGMHKARVEQRVRPATPGEIFTLDQLAGDFGRLPKLPAEPTPTDVSDWVQAFFQSAAVVIAQVTNSAAADGDNGSAAVGTDTAMVDEDGVMTFDGPSQSI